MVTWHCNEHKESKRDLVDKSIGSIRATCRAEEEVGERKRKMGGRSEEWERQRGQQLQQPTVPRAATLVSN